MLLQIERDGIDMNLETVEYLAGLFEIGELLFGDDAE